MDIYEFTQVLWRRKWLLLSGIVVLIVAVAALTMDFSNGIRLKSNPKFEARVQMAVVPEDLESLSQNLGNDSLAAAAGMFASLLSSPQAALEIQKRQRIPDFGLAVATTGRDRFFTVDALSSTPDGAVSAALGSYDWLEERLTEPLNVASAPTTTQPPAPLLDSDGEFRGSVVLEIDHALATDAEGLWLVTRTHANDEFAFRLTDAADETATEYTSLLTPGAPIFIALEDATGFPLDSTTVDLPSLPSDGAGSYRLVMGLDRGLVRGTVVESEFDGRRTIEAPLLDADRVRLSWEPTMSSADQVVSDELSGVGILLLTDEPVPNSIGGRRTPLLIVAMTTAGIIALIVFAVAVDSWIQQRLKRARAHTDDSPAPLAQAIQLSSQEPPDESRRVGS